MVDVDEVRKTVAIKHEFLIGEDDPLAIMVTMTDTLLKQCVDSIIEQNKEDNEAHQKAIINALQLGNAEAKQTAGRVITEAGDYVSEQVSMAVTAAMEEGIGQFLELRAKAQEDRRIAVFAAAVSAVCAVVSLGAFAAKVFLT
jgi:hypothetical protein